MPAPDAVDWALAPAALVGLIDVVLVLAVSVFWFEVPLRGSVWLLFLTTFVYLLTTLGLGLFVSTISQTQQQAIAPRERRCEAMRLLRRVLAIGVRHAIAAGAVDARTGVRVVVVAAFELQLAAVREIPDVRETGFEDDLHLIGADWVIAVAERLDRRHRDLIHRQTHVAVHRLARLRGQAGVGLVVVRHRFARASQRFKQAPQPYRFKQIIDCVQLKCLDCIGIVSGSENDDRWLG